MYTLNLIIKYKIARREFSKVQLDKSNLMAGKRFFSKEVQKKKIFSLEVLQSDNFSLEYFYTQPRPITKNLFIFKLQVNFIASETISDMNLFRLWEKSVSLKCCCSFLLLPISSFVFTLTYTRKLHAHDRSERRISFIFFSSQTWNCFKCYLHEIQ